VSGSTWKIYLLRDPRDLSARYVGATVKTLDKRLAAHVYSASRPYNKAPRFVWIRELVDLGLTPSIEMLEHVPEGSRCEGCVRTGGSTRSAKAEPISSTVRRAEEDKS
jgi:hypothetical protein